MSVSNKARKMTEQQCKAKLFSVALHLGEDEEVTTQRVLSYIRWKDANLRKKPAKKPLKKNGKSKDPSDIIERGIKVI